MYIPNGGVGKHVISDECCIRDIQLSHGYEAEVESKAWRADRSRPSRSRFEDRRQTARVQTSSLGITRCAPNRRKRPQWQVDKDTMSLSM